MQFQFVVQILALSYYFSPRSGTTDRVRPRSVASVSFVRCFDRPSDKGKYPRSMPLSMIAESGKYDGLLLCFRKCENQRKGVLKFSQWYGEDETSSSAQMLLDRAHVVAFKFPNQTNSPAQPMETRGCLVSCL